MPATNVIHSFILFYFAFNKKYNNSIQKYIKDNIQYSTKTKPEMNLPRQIFDEFALGKSILPSAGSDHTSPLGARFP